MDIDLRALLPHLRIKKKQAENCLALRAIKNESKNSRVALGRNHIGAAKRSIEHSNAMDDCLKREASQSDWS